MKIFIVEDTANSPGRVLAVFAHKEGAEEFKELLPTASEVVERTLYYGQPPIRGYNQ